MLNIKRMYKEFKNSKQKLYPHNYTIDSDVYLELGDLIGKDEYTLIPIEYSKYPNGKRFISKFEISQIYNNYGYKTKFGLSEEQHYKNNVYIWNSWFNGKIAFLLIKSMLDNNNNFIYITNYEAIIRYKHICEEYGRNVEYLSISDDQYDYDNSAIEDINLESIINENKILFIDAKCKISDITKYIFDKLEKIQFNNLSIFLNSHIIDLNTDMENIQKIINTNVIPENLKNSISLNNIFTFPMGYPDRLNLLYTKLLQHKHISNIIHMNDENELIEIFNTNELQFNIDIDNKIENIVVDIENKKYSYCEKFKILLPDWLNKRYEETF